MTDVTVRYIATTQIVFTSWRSLHRRIIIFISYKNSHSRRRQ